MTRAGMGSEGRRIDDEADHVDVEIGVDSSILSNS